MSGLSTSYLWRVGERILPHFSGVVSCDHLVSKLLSHRMFTNISQLFIIFRILHFQTFLVHVPQQSMHQNLDIEKEVIGQLWHTMFIKTDFIFGIHWDQKQNCIPLFPNFYFKPENLSLPIQLEFRAMILLVADFIHQLSLFIMTIISIPEHSLTFTTSVT